MSAKEKYLPEDLQEPFWERQSQIKETDRAFAAFCKYYLDDRSLAEIFGRGTSELRQAEAWSSKFCWVVRKRAWFDSVQETARKKKAVEIEKMLDRHANQSAGFLAVFSQTQAAYLKRSQSEKGKKELEKMDMGELSNHITKQARVVPALQQAEATARGIIPKQKHEITGADGGPLETKSELVIRRVIVSRTTDEEGKLEEEADEQ